MIRSFPMFLCSLLWRCDILSQIKKNQRSRRFRHPTMTPGRCIRHPFAPWDARPTENTQQLQRVAKYLKTWYRLQQNRGYTQAITRKIEHVATLTSCNCTLMKMEMQTQRICTDMTKSDVVVTLLRI